MEGGRVPICGQPRCVGGVVGLVGCGCFKVSVTGGGFSTCVGKAMLAFRGGAGKFRGFFTCVGGIGRTIPMIIFRPANRCSGPVGDCYDHGGVYFVRMGPCGSGHFVRTLGSGVGASGGSTCNLAICTRDLGLIPGNGCFGRLRRLGRLMSAHGFLARRGVTRLGHHRVGGRAALGLVRGRMGLCRGRVTRVGLLVRGGVGDSRSLGGLTRAVGCNVISGKVNVGLVSALVTCVPRLNRTDTTRVTSLTKLTPGRGRSNAFHNRGEVQNKHGTIHGTLCVASMYLTAGPFDGSRGVTGCCLHLGGGNGPAGLILATIDRGVLVEVGTAIGGLCSGAGGWLLYLLLSRLATTGEFF